MCKCWHQSYTHGQTSIQQSIASSWNACFSLSDKFKLTLTEVKVTSRQPKQLVHTSNGDSLWSSCWVCLTHNHSCEGSICAALWCSFCLKVEASNVVCLLILSHFRQQNAFCWLPRWCWNRCMPRNLMHCLVKACRMPFEVWTDEFWTHWTNDCGLLSCRVHIFFKCWHESLDKWILFAIIIIAPL